MHEKKSQTAKQIRVVKLVSGEHNSHVLYRLQRGWFVHFMLGPTLASKDVTIFCNVPLPGEAFNRTVYRPLQWKNYSTLSKDKFDFYAAVEFTSSGSFQYYFSHDGIENAGSGYFLVDPTLTIGSDNHVLPLDALCMQTVMTKALGPFQQWKGRLKVAKESGYNALHFTPIQKLGLSNSSYSLADQLALNSILVNDPVPCDFNDIKELVQEMRNSWNIMSVTDVVWNHTASDSSWLQDFPECGYNLENSPHLRPAYLLDRAIYHLSMDIAKGKYTEKFFENRVTSQEHVESFRLMLTDTLPSLRLWEFFQIDVDAYVEKFMVTLRNSTVSDGKSKETISLIQDPKYRRLGCSIDLEVAIQQFYVGNNTDVAKACTALKDTLEWLNETRKEVCMDDITAGIRNVISGIIYERVADHGLKRLDITQDYPLSTLYFNHLFPNTSVKEEEATIMENEEKCRHIAAHNGWVMGDDALKNFADPSSKVYLRRELVCWGDTVKLRYGKEPSDCQVLWDRMKEYTEMMASLFHGIRIDNCHSTPIHVAEYMLDSARRIRPDLYVFAELFTGSEHVDNIFINRLGITSLVRESMSAWDSHELGRIVYMYGGEPISSFRQPSTQALVPSRAHALLYDISHDNESMMTKHTITDILPSTALVSMACCAVGSTRGHDELVPHHINVVTDDRKYREWSSNGKNPSLIGSKSGVVNGKRMLNMLHQTMALNGFTQVFVDQRTPDVIAITRHNSKTHYSYVMIAHTAFKASGQNFVPCMTMEGQAIGVTIEAKPTNGTKNTREYIDAYVKDEDYINGIDDYGHTIEMDLPIALSNSIEIETSKQGKAFTIHFADFPPGSVVVLKVKNNETVDENILKIRGLVEDLRNNANTGFDKIAAKLDLRALNRVLFRCNEEEKSDGFGIGSYGVPNWKELTYCGIAGIAVPFAKVRSSNDLGHPLCDNLRDGNWLMDYIAMRLQKHEETKDIGDWYESCFAILGQLPRYLVPTYFEPIISLTYEKLLTVCFNQMSDFVKNGSSFTHSLALGAVALCGFVKGALLPKVHPDVREIALSDEDADVQILSSMAAGLPHFSSGVMRSWGRDTFISMHGILLVTGQYIDARNLILAFAGCMRHGLMPNLLGEGKISRYNCRDAVWFWLECIQELCETHSYQLLQLPVARIFPTDNSEALPVGSCTQPLYDVVQEAMQRHVDGILFRERNAGPQIDRNMSDPGFLVEASVKLDTGFVYGGSKYNCGTWCDKMGESEKAGTRGVPATPRDGSAVELVALCKSTVSWLNKANSVGKYPYDGVFIKTKGQKSETSKLSWSQWDRRIQDNFEKFFFVGEDDASSLVHKRNIYKDTVGASSPWCDYQLRPNFTLAMVYAPELFDAKHAWAALNMAQEKLLGPMGMKTLDPDDLQYRGDYDNSNDGTDSSVAKGFNYHQGPEWLWPVGYFLRAKLYFAKRIGPAELKDTIEFIQSYLVTHQLHLDNSPWCGLPELTNSDGKECRDSCEIQAWSHATLLDLLSDMSKLD